MSETKIRVRLRDNSTSVKKGRSKENFILSDEVKVVSKDDEFIKACLKTKVLVNLGEVKEEKPATNSNKNKENK